MSLDIGALAVQGPRSRDLLTRLVPEVEQLPFFGITTGTIGSRPVTVSRTGYTGDLGYEIWVETPDAVTVWDALWDSVDGYGVLPYGLAALRMLRIEAGPPAAPRRLRQQPLRLQRRASVDPDRARLVVDVQGAGR